MLLNHANSTCQGFAVQNSLTMVLPRWRQPVGDMLTLVVRPLPPGHLAWGFCQLSSAQGCVDWAAGTPPGRKPPGPSL